MSGHIQVFNFTDEQRDLHFYPICLAASLICAAAQGYLRAAKVGLLNHREGTSSAYRTACGGSSLPSFIYKTLGLNESLRDCFISVFKYTQIWGFIIVQVSTYNYVILAPSPIWMIV